MISAAMRGNNFPRNGEDIIRYIVHKKIIKMLRFDLLHSQKEGLFYEYQTKRSNSPDGIM